MRYGKHLFIWVMAMCMLSACVTHKKRDDVGKIAKMYHDITSKYNRNFNANVLIDESFLALDASYVEDYSELLPLYPHVDKENPTALAEPMDQAIEKASVAIAIHRPSHWTDDNYLIIARSQFIKEDFESAEATLRYLIKHYDPDNLVKASSSKSRNVNSKMTDREKEAERKELEKERVFKVKERQKEIRENKKARKQKKNARKDRIKERKKEIKEREKLAKQGKSRKPASSTPKKSDVAKDEGKKKKENEIPFDEDPELPKVKGNPDNYFLKHKPAFQDAQLLLARTLVERDRFGEAENILRRLENDERTFEEIRREVYVVQAHSALSRGQMAAATAPLILAIEHADDRLKEARYSYILAQIYEKLNQHQQALDAYDQVAKIKPGYEMTFNATLSKLHMQWNTNDVGSEEFEKTLEKLIKDSKNLEFQDQLYYSLAMRELELGNRKEAIAHLSSAARYSIRNVAQKADAYYTIASLYYEDEDYVRAKHYFDSTAAVMPQSDERLDEVRSYAKNLTEIAANLETVTMQDSLIDISNMSEDEVKSLAARIKKEMAEAEAAKQRAVNQPSKVGTANLQQVSRSGAVGATASNFFAYDDREVKKGLREFERKWGNITLSDDWRRSHDATFDGIQSQAASQDFNVVAPISNTEIEEIFQNVPKSEAELVAANKKIEDALFNLGRLFRSELENPEKSVEVLEEMLTRYPNSEHALDAYYLLYVSYNDLANATKATFYADKINSLFGDSEYAKFINNPSYLANLKSEEEMVEEVYQRAHRLYDEGAYTDAFRVLRDAATELGTKHALQSKYALLSAMCIGRTKGREPYVNALKELIAKYPDTEEEQRAKEIIRLLGIRFTETSEGIQEINPDSYFDLGPNDKVHMILVALKKSDGETQNKALTSVSDYNKKYHRLDDIKLATISLDDGKGSPTPLLVLRKFDTREKAMAYYDGVQKNLKDFISDSNSYEIFAASQRNYRNIVQLKSVDLYRTFFVKEYLTK